MEGGLLFDDVCALKMRRHAAIAGRSTPARAPTPNKINVTGAHE